MLKFIGSGSAFNTKLGNNSAYYKEGNQLLLIDCGSNIFQRIKESSLLDGVENINVLITHTHADHVGSLADLILYTYYSHGEFAKSKVTVYAPEDTYISTILELNGIVIGEHCESKEVIPFELNTIDGTGIVVSSIQTKHVEEIHSYGYSININGVKIYYSGDTNNIWDKDLSEINNLNYDYVYIDTCKADYEGNVHLSLRKLSELIDPKVRDRVYCMHLDESFNREEAEDIGFNVVWNDYGMS